MQIKLFGKNLFEFKSGLAHAILGEAQSSNRESKYLPDFMSLSETRDPFSSFVSIGEAVQAAPAPERKDAKPEREKLTPKGVYNLKLLHDASFKLNVDPAYLEKQLEDFRDKLSLIKSEEYDMRRGVVEIASVVTRLENRKRYAEFHAFFEEFPYTSTARINDLTKDHDYLKLGQIAQFLADMPKEAVDVMKRYNKTTQDLCKKDPVFYIIADKKDFKKSDKRRDPILLAQSPFGHFWQILGAWDEEMMLLEDL